MEYRENCFGFTYRPYRHTEWANVTTISAFKLISNFLGITFESWCTSTDSQKDELLGKLVRYHILHDGGIDIKRSSVHFCE